MDSLRRVPWSWVTDELIATWSAMEVILSAEHELVQKSTRAFAYAHALVDQGGYGYTSGVQQQLILEVYPKTAHFLGISYWMTIWLFSREGKKPQLIPAIERLVPKPGLVPGWTADELITNVHAEFTQDAIGAWQISTRLSQGDLGFTSSEQSEVIVSLTQAVASLKDIIRCIALWLSIYGSCR